jgi:hypothetical protein
MPATTSHQQESSHQWWFGYKSGSSASLMGLVVMCRLTMCYLVEDWFEQNEQCKKKKNKKKKGAD